jgi:hypothetical protein
MNTEPSRPHGAAESSAASAYSSEEITRFVVEAAVHAPSVHNTQPWWFHAGDHETGIHADTARRLPIADPDGREMVISCGAALFTARVALRYLGLVPTVTMFPDASLPNLLARITWSQSVPAAEYERELFVHIKARRTHRGGFNAEPLPDGLVAALCDEAAKEGAKLRAIRDHGERAALAAVVQAADYALRQDAARAREEARWAPPPGSGRLDGVPASSYPARPGRTEPHFPSRDFAHGRGWGLPPAGQGQLPRSAGVVALLSTEGDRPGDWVAAGQSLQRVLLFATSCGVRAAMHSQPLEIPQLRAFIRTQFCAGRHPQMVLRFGADDQRVVSVRRPVEDVLF